MIEAVKALLDYQQADEDGVMVLTSRQAIHETVAHIEKLEAALRPFADAARRVTYPTPDFRRAEEVIYGPRAALEDK